MTPTERNLKADRDELKKSGYRIMRLEYKIIELRKALVQITKLRWGNDGDCGAVAIAERALDNVSHE